MGNNTDNPEPVNSSGEDYLVLTSGAKILRTDITKSALFCDVIFDDIAIQLGRCDIRSFAAGENILDAGSINHQVFLLLSGILSVFITEEGSNSVTVNLHPGQSVGEISVIDGQPASAQVTATVPSSLLVIDSSIFWSFVAISTQFSHNVMAILAYRIRNGNIAIVDSVRLQKQYEHHATVDSLTGLRNRRWFDSTLDKQLKRDSFNQTSTCLIILDIDNFKAVNDKYGHVAGDQVLSSVGTLINSGVRPADLSTRYGGEEFAIILPDTALSEATQVAERLRLKMDSKEFNVDYNPDNIKLTMSLGVAESTPGESVRSLVYNADKALYQAKENGRNRTHFEETR